MLDESEDDLILGPVFERIERKVDNMLLSEPLGAPDACVKFWKTLKPLCLDQFEVFNVMISDRDAPLEIEETMLR